MEAKPIGETTSVPLSDLGVSDSCSPQTGLACRFRRFLAPTRGFVEQHKNALWWLHSAYALLLGILVMWLG
jgi:hypothetical protein